MSRRDAPRRSRDIEYAEPLSSAEIEKELHEPDAASQRPAPDVQQPALGPQPLIEFRRTGPPVRLRVRARLKRIARRPQA